MKTSQIATGRYPRTAGHHAVDALNSQLTYVPTISLTVIPFCPEIQVLPGKHIHWAAQLPLIPCA